MRYNNGPEVIEIDSKMPPNMNFSTNYKFVTITLIHHYK